MSFNEFNTVEHLILETVESFGPTFTAIGPGGLG